MDLDMKLKFNFNTCLLYEHDIDKGWMPKETIYIDCVEV